MDRQPHLEGGSVRLRPMQESDFDRLFAVAQDRELWAQHPVNDRWEEPVFRSFFEDAMRSGGALVLEDRETGDIIGSTQLRPHSLDLAEMEIGWTFVARSRWGSGSNREMKKLLVGYALEEMPRVLFRVGEHNLRSRAAMEKIGARLLDVVERTEFRGSEVVHVVYEITRDDFASGPLSS